MGTRNALGKVSFNGLKQGKKAIKTTNREVKKEMGKRNDDRSNSMNPNNPSYQASQENRSNQLNPNHPEYSEDEEK